MQIISKIDLFKKDGGYSSIIAIVVITILSFLSTTILDMTSVDSQIKNHDLQSSQSMLIGNAGIQYALFKLNNGLSPSNTTKNLNGGQFTITTQPATSKVTVTSQIGDAQDTQSISTKFSHDCTTINLDLTVINADKVDDIRFKKECHTKIILTALVLDWDSGGSNPITAVKVDESVVYGPEGSTNPGSVIDIPDWVVSDSIFHKIRFQFAGTVTSPNTFLLTLIFKDESEKSVQFNL